MGAHTGDMTAASPGATHGETGGAQPAGSAVPENWREYPPPPAPPSVPAHKREAARADLQYYPRWHGESHPTHWTFPESLNPAVRWVAALKRLYAMPLSFPSSLAPEAGLLVHAIVRNHRPRVVIETGCFVGVSTIWIAAALAENGDGGILHSFDDFSPIRKGAWRSVQMSSGRMRYVQDRLIEAGVSERVRLHAGNSCFEIRARWDELRAAGGAGGGGGGGGGGVDLAYLDADHGVEGATQDFWATEGVLKTGGLVILHDTFPEYCGSYEGPRHVLDRCNAIGVGLYEKMDLYLSPVNYGLGVLRRIG